MLFSLLEQEEEDEHEEGGELNKFVLWRAIRKIFIK